jgi:hypothetical protein
MSDEERQTRFCLPGTLLVRLTPSSAGWSDANGVLAESPWIVIDRLSPVRRKLVRKAYVAEINI